MNKTVIVRDLTLNFANVYSTVSPFGEDQWDVQVTTPDADKAKELIDLGVSMKEKDGVYKANIKRKFISSKTKKENSPPVVLDANKQPMTAGIGNGSKGHIKLYSYEYNVQGRSGIAAMFSAIQVIDLIEYTPGGPDFEVEGGDADGF